MGGGIVSERLTDDMVAYLSALDAPMQAGL